MTLTAPGCPSAQELPDQVRDAVMAVPGVRAATWKWCGIRRGTRAA